MGQPVEGFFKNGNKNEEESEKRKIDRLLLLSSKVKLQHKFTLSNLIG